MLELRDTVKLFYGKYLYKIDLNMPYGHYFRNNDLSYARKALDAMNKQYEQDEDITPPLIYKCVHNLWFDERIIDPKIFHNLQKLYHILKDSKKYTLRIENNILSVYTNNYGLIDRLFNALGKQTFAIHKPKDEVCKKLLQGEEKVLFVKSQSKYNYKLILRITDISKYEEFTDHCASLDYCSTPSAVSTLSYWKSSQRTLYIKDKKALNFLLLFDGFVVQSIYKLICKKDG